MPMEHFDVLVVGAGISGIGAGYYLQTRCPGKRYALPFAAGFMMLVGARLADGCTSGHGLSGMAQLAVGSTIAVAAMFAGGIATALLVFRRI